MCLVATFDVELSANHGLQMTDWFNTSTDDTGSSSKGASLLNELYASAKRLNEP